MGLHVQAFRDRVTVLLSWFSLSFPEDGSLCVTPDIGVKNGDGGRTGLLFLDG